jgi:addiction module RelE/StbE family toxin
VTRVIWTPEAEEELDGIAEYIADENPLAAARVVKRIRDKAASLFEFPNRAPRGRIEDTRELLVLPTPYIISYRVIDDAAWILSVFDPARDLLKLA